MNEDIYNRLKTLMRHAEIKNNKLADLIGVSSGQMSGMLKGSDFGISKLISIANQFPNINAEWLLRGKGEMILREGEAPATTEEIERVYKEMLDERDKREKSLLETIGNLSITTHNQSEQIKEMRKQIEKAERKFV